MGILIKAGVDDHGLRSRKSIAQTSTTSTSIGHTATATTYNKHPVTDALQQQLRTMMSAIQGRKAFVQCAILVAVVLLALTANAAAQEHRRHGARPGLEPSPHHGGGGHSPRPHHGGGGHSPPPHHGGGGHSPPPHHGGGGHSPRPHHGYDPCGCQGGCQWVWGSNI